MARNRDIATLQRVLALMAEAEKLEERRAWERARLTSARGQRLTGMPGGGGVPQGIDAALSRLSDLEEEHGEKLNMYVAAMKAAEKILNGIEDEDMRAFVLLRYVFGEEMAAVKAALNLTDWAARRAREAVEEADSMKGVKWPRRRDC